MDVDAHRGIARIGARLVKYLDRDVDFGDGLPGQRPISQELEQAMQRRTLAQPSLFEELANLRPQYWIANRTVHEAAYAPCNVV